MQKIICRLEPNAWHGYATETLWAEPIGVNRFRLRSVPFYAKGISFDDVVMTKRESNTDVIERRTASDLIAALDSAHVQKALVLSTAYWFGAPDAVPDPNRDEYTRVRAENDWVAAQVAQYPTRLVGFCAVNPLRDYALRETSTDRPRSCALRNGHAFRCIAECDGGVSPEAVRAHAGRGAADIRQRRPVYEVRNRLTRRGCRDRAERKADPSLRSG